MIWGLKTVAIFDVWSFEHLLTGISIGTITIFINQAYFKNRLNIDESKFTLHYFDVITVLFAAFIWETVEHYLETGLAGNRVEFWFQGVEYWANRIIADPLITLLGYCLARSKPMLVNVARVLTVIWMFVHIFIFPHSMYLHKIL
jgi:hypothetical protein